MGEETDRKKPTAPAAPSPCGLARPKSGRGQAIPSTYTST